MNRLAHLQRTLIRNMEDNIDYPAVEFNLLDYNSADGLGEWVRANLRQYIDAGILKYYHTSHPPFFDRSHSKNMLFRLASGDIVCNVDADNYTGKGFAYFLNRRFQESGQDCIMIPERVVRDEEDRNTYGRICIPKPLFLRTNGFDEKMVGYGFEDTDLIHRVKQQGAEERFITDRDFLGSISHSHRMRVSEDELTRELDTVLIAYINHYCSRVIFLLKNGLYEIATFFDLTIARCLPRIPEGVDLAPGTETYEVAIPEDQREEGRWERNGERLVLTAVGHTELLGSVGGNFFEGPGGQRWLPVTDSALVDQLVYVYPQIKNRNRMDANLTAGRKVNACGFGIGRVELNFTGDFVELQ